MTEPTFLDYAEDAKTYTQPLTAREERALRRKERSEQDSKVLYKCVFKGVIFVQDGEDKKVVPYEETVFMDHKLINAGPPHVFVKYYADAIFKAKYPGYIPRPKEHHLTSTTRLDGLPLTDIRLMGRESLEDYIDDHELSVEPDLYDLETELRTAIKECEADPKGFQKQQDRRRELTGKAAEVRRQVQSVQDRVASLIARSKELQEASDAPQDFTPPTPPHKAQPVPTGDAPSQPAQPRGGRPRKPTVDEQLGDV